MKKLIQIGLLLLLIGAFACSRNSNIAGGSTAVTENTISGIVVDSNGVGKEGILVSLYQKTYSSVHPVGEVPKTLTDSNGHFTFEEVNPNIYNLEVLDSETKQNGIFQNVLLNDKESVIIPVSIQLSDPGGLNINISEFNVEVGDVIIIPGTSVATIIDSFVINEGVINLEDIPADTISDIVIVNPNNPGSTDIISDSVVVDPGEIGRLHVYRDWQYSKPLFIDVNSLGKNLNNYPLLLRLDDSNFDFSQTQEKGNDIRFLRSDSIVLSFEIERWNLNTKTAVVWISMDSLVINNPTMNIEMYWGNPNVDIPKFKEWPFHYNFGFGGVWHLKENQKDTVANELYVNSVGAADYGDDRVSTSNTDGVIGKAAHIVGEDYINVLHASQALKPMLFTLSAWVNVARVRPEGGEIISMGDNYGLRVEGSGIIRFFIVEISGVAVAKIHTTKNVMDGNWHHVAATYDGSEQRLYVDGILDSSKVDPDNFTYNIEDNFSIGRHSHKSPSFKMLDGKIDEVRVEHVVRDEHWIKFTYETQKLGAALITSNNSN